MGGPEREGLGPTTDRRAPAAHGRAAPHMAARCARMDPEQFEPRGDYSDTTKQRAAAQGMKSPRLRWRARRRSAT
jgi:hypothetical protein